MRGVHWAKECIKAWNKKPLVEHHRLSILFLKPGGVLRASVDIFIASGVMPPLLRLQTAPLLFVPLGDSMIEREHKYVSDVVRTKTGVRLGHAFNIKRLRTVEQRLSSEPDFREKLVQHYLSLSTTKGAIKAMGLEHHPMFMELFKAQGDEPAKKVTQFIRSLLEKIVYRQELGMKYEGFGIAKRLAERQDERSKTEVGRKAQKVSTLPGSVEEVLLMNTPGHLQFVGGTYGMITMPERTDGQIHLEGSTVEQALHGDVPVEEEASRRDIAMEDLDSKRRRLSELSAVVAQAQREEHAREDVRDDLPPKQCCFRVVLGRPTQGKSISTFIYHGGAVLKPTDFAVTLHVPFATASADTLSVDLCPRVLSSCSASRVFIVQGFNPGRSLDTLLASAKGWHTPAGSKPKPWFHLPIGDLDGKAVNDAVLELFDSNALRGHDSALDVDLRNKPWAQLLQHEFIQVVDDGNSISSPAPEVHIARVQLTDKAMASLSTGVAFDACSPLFAPRYSLPLADMSPFELGMLLKEKGWQWELMPQKTADRRALTHPTDREVGTWYTLGKTIVPAYARCLLSCSELRERYGLNDVPHYVKRPLKDYELLLKGKPIPQAAPVRRQALMAFDQEFPDDLPAELLQLADEQDLDEAPLPHECDGDEAGVLEQWLEHVIELEEAMLTEDTQVEPANSPEAEPEQDEVEEETLQPPHAKRRAGKRGALEVERWGCFEIARKRVNHIQSALECRCRFHRLNDSTGCKRTIGYTAESEEHVLAVARWWCNQATKWRKQSDHRTCFRDIMEVPHYPLELLRAEQITDPPSGYVRTDEEIDAQDAGVGQ